MPTKLFLRGDANDSTTGYKQLLSAAGSGATTWVSDTTTAGGTQIGFGGVTNWISGYTPPGGFTLTSADISLWLHENSMSANIGGRVRIFKRAANGTETELGGGPFDDGVELGTSAGEMTWIANVTDTAFAVNDRVLLKVYVTAAGGTMAAGFIGTLTTDGADASTGDSFIQLVETVAFSTHPFPDAPTLNSPADASSTSDTTPTLDFTGTAPDSDSLEYEVQIDSLSTFDSVSGSFLTYALSAGSSSKPLTTSSGEAESFQGQNKFLTKARFYIKKTGSPTGTVVAKLYAHSGTYGTSSIPSPSNKSGALATSNTINATDVPTVSQFVTFVFPTPYQLVAGTNYVIAIEASAGDASNRIDVQYDTVGSNYGGNASEYALGAYGANSGIDFWFDLQEALPQIDKFSATDTGFVNPDTGGDTHPFNSGENIQYTVQSALAAGTYYWRVRVRDASSGSTSDWSDWSSTRSLVISSTPRSTIPSHPIRKYEHLLVR